LVRERELRTSFEEELTDNGVKPTNYAENNDLEHNQIR